MNKTYWTTRDGRKIDVDIMDEAYLRNCLKLLIHNCQGESPLEESEFDDIEELDESWNNGEFYK